MSPRRPPRRRRAPTWVLGALVAALLTASVALFVLDATQDDTPTKPASAERGSSKDDSELVLPDGDDGDATDARRRSELGRGRSEADGDDATTSEDDAAATQDVAALDGKTIALVPADATAVNGSDASKLERIGALRLPCAPSGSSAALARQRELLDAVAQRLRAAGARVVRVDDARGAVPCAGDRSAAFERADLALVVATGEDAPSAMVARTAGKLTTTDAMRARQLVDALGSELGIDGVTSTSAPKVADLLDEHGVVDRPGGGTVAWLALGDASDELDADKLAGSITSALARAFAPATAAPRGAPATTTRPTPRPAPTPTPTTPTPTTPKPATPTTPSSGSDTGSSGPDSDD